MESKPKLYQNIIDHFTALADEGKLKPGDRIPTEQEIAEQFGVSRITVIRALKDLEYRGMLVRIKRKGSFIREDYVNGGAITVEVPVKERLPIIAVVLPFGEEYGLDILQGVEQFCASQGYYVTYHNTGYSLKREREVLLKFLEDNISGAIVYPCASDQNIEIFGSLMIHKFPFVLIDRTIEGLDVPCVVSNNFQGGQLITQHLLQLGHSRIAFVCARLKEAVSVMERYRGYCKSLIDAGIMPRSEWLIEDEEESAAEYDDSPDGQLKLAMERLERVLNRKEKVTAAIAINDKSAMYMLKAAQEMGVKVPHELSIVGFDNLSFAGMLDVSLTTIEQKFTLQGREAAAMVLRLCGEENPFRETKKVTLPTELIVRKSSDRPHE
ncbi:LacI family DNA-binding transcriptional regulator [Cohnella sp. AR92]|uniref:LacI family DNA-binding transcriptional regulator n=1 Tax=Cohnella sp. AR92 TaxID=648716 RepID=UPI000F8D12F2|nr:GntR family transcriptional regulator [Cohnella sp. AR92]RUS47500.1 GntR family transcriptional regulator [Cohnella sp. AR92]